MSSSIVIEFIFPRKKLLVATVNLIDDRRVNWKESVSLMCSGNFPSKFAYNHLTFIYTWGG